VKILLDECVPKRLGRLLSTHDVVTTPEAGWAGVGNGELLERASKDFDVFITVDRNLTFQQNPSNLPLPVIVIHAPSNKLKDLVNYLPALQQTLLSDLVCQAYHIGALRLVDLSNN